MRIGLFLLLLGGCVSSYRHPNVGPGLSRRVADGVWQRAEFDLQCERNEIHLQKVAQNQVGARGCGQQAVYINIRGTGWVRDQ